MRRSDDILLCNISDKSITFKVKKNRVRKKAMLIDDLMTARYVLSYSFLRSAMPTLSLVTGHRPNFSTYPCTHG